LAADDKLTASLDPQGWYREFESRRRLAYIRKHYDHEDWPQLETVFAAGLKPVHDPREMDRLMCRTEPVAKVETPVDLSVALYNGRLVVEIDPSCLDDVLFQKIKNLLKAERQTQVKSKPNRHISLEAWVNHRILSLYDLQLNGYDLSRRRKQLAKWLFPEIANPKARGDKYDRARELLTQALVALPTLRAWG
jgi:hypothetical protein